MKPSFRRLLATGFFLAMAPSAFAFDSASYEQGYGDNTQLFRVGVQWQWPQQWWSSDGKHLGAYWDLTLSQWRWSHIRNAIDTRATLHDIGITPVLRWQADGKKGFYAEAGIGAHLFSSDYEEGLDQRFSTRFQFGDHVGIGYVLQNGLDLSLKLQHFSNGGIQQPNPGVLFGILKLGYTF